jgi:hypothetical protein
MPTARTADAAGWEVLDAAVVRAQRLLGAALAGAYAIGSLAHGGFAAATSDVDLALLTEGDGTIEQVAAALADDVARTTGTELGTRLSVFHVPRRAVAAPPPGARFPAIDRLDLLDSGILVAGRDVRDPAMRPDRATVVEEAVAFTAQRTDVGRLLDLPAAARDGAADVRKTTKAVLAPVRLAVLVEEGRVLGNAAAADRYKGDFGALVHGAVAWRAGGRLPAGGDLARLLAKELLALHLEQLGRARGSAGVRGAQRLDVLMADLTRALHHVG